jgi:hypothetical protein
MHVGAEDLELYLLDRLEKGRAAGLEAHLAGCAPCVQKLSSARFFDQLVELSRKQADFNGVEKRRERRVSTYDAGVLQTINPFSPDRLNVNILDVSKSGMKIGGPMKLVPGGSVKIRVKSMIAFGEVRHCREVGAGYESGILLFDSLPT